MTAEQTTIVVSVLMMFFGLACALVNFTGNMVKIIPGTLMKIGTMRNKFPVDFNPPGFMFPLSFVTHIPTIALGLIVTYRIAGSMKVFDKAFYFHTLSFALMSILYVFFYGFELLSFTAYSIVIITFNSIVMFIMALQRRGSTEKGTTPIPKSWEWWYDLLVINSYPPFIGWYVHSVCWFGAVALSYVDQPGPVAQERGWLSIPEAGTVLICGMLALVCVWIVLDWFVYPQYTKYVWTMYPELVLVGFAVYIHSVRQGHGGNFNYLMYLVMGVISLVGWAFRGRYHGKKHSVKYD